MEQELQETIRSNNEHKEQLKRSDGFIRKLGQIVHCHRTKKKAEILGADPRYIKKYKDVPALEYLSDQINKLLCTHKVLRPKTAAHTFQRSKSQDQPSNFFAVLNDSNDLINHRRFTDYEELPSSRTLEELKDDSSVCTYCRKEFTWCRWRHHCRMCGKLVCNTCSPYKQYLVGYSDCRVRVCKECHCVKN